MGGASSRLVEGLEEKGFAISPFHDGGKILTIPCDHELDDNSILTPEDAELQDSTDKKEYLKEVSELINHHRRNHGKTVAARCIRMESKINLSATFDSLCREYPEAFVFMFSTQTTGTWIGASPELLLEVRQNEISTVALAGTRRSSESGPWDKKNVEEQMMVVRFITDCLDRNCENVNVLHTYTKNAGRISHICTPIKASLPTSSLSDILMQLSPTPALCGNNRKESFDLINKYEKISREMYGGFCGPYKMAGDTSSFYVIIRVAKCNNESVCIYAGGGITEHSVAEEEWNETEMKSKTIINYIKSNQQ